MEDVIKQLGDDYGYKELMALGTDDFSTRSWLMVNKK